jgi:thioredoxin 1
MSETIEHPAEIATARYELAISIEEAQRGVTKILTRNGKKVEVVVPPGVSGGSVVKLGNALQLTDGITGDILIQIKIKMPEFTKPEPKFEGVVPISDSDFDSQVLQSPLPVVVDFWAPWCGPCRMMAPVMDEAAIKYRGKFKFCKINVDENQQSAARYKAMSIPLLIFFKGGQAVDQSLGAIPAGQLKAKLDSLL